MMSTPQPVHYPATRGHRFHLLDGLRGLAALLVVLYHLPLTLHSGLPMRQAWLAVDFFFLLSGFVIAFSYQSRLAAGLRLKDFAAARLIRLYPLYLVGSILGLLSVVLVDSLSAHVTLPVANLALATPFALLLVPNFLHHWPQPYCFPFNVPAWSLFLELLANFLFAILLRRRLGRSGLVVALVVISFLILLAATLSHSIDTLDLGGSLGQLPLSLARVAFSFFAGVLLYRIYNLNPGRRLPTFYAAVATLALLAVLIYSSAVTATPGYQLAIVALVFPAIVFCGACAALPQSLNRLCALLGDLSYPLYILHAPFVFPMGGSKPQAFLHLHPGAAPAVLALTFASLIALSWFAARYPDRSIRRSLTRRYNAVAA